MLIACEEHVMLEQCVMEVVKGLVAQRATEVDADELGTDARSKGTNLHAALLNKTVALLDWHVERAEYANGRATDLYCRIIVIVQYLHDLARLGRTTRA